MSDKIRILPNHITNQISDGEVVQRPASIVKELLENSIDAEAKSIQLILQDAGKSLIKVIDDGKGMSIKDARKSFLRYATSKIKTTDDLFRIRTMGFRGQALASIASVCQVEMQTRRKEDEIGISLFIEGNKLKGEEFVQISKGTTITIKNIFYNLPARKKQFNSNQVELRKIMDEFNRLTLAHPNIRFILFHKRNNKLKKYFDFPPASLRNRIVEVLGKKINKEMISVDEQVNSINLKGYFINPSYSNKSLRKQFIFVNNRYIKSSFLSKTVFKAFKGFFTYVNPPSYFLFFFLDPKFIDLNIHPTKNEISFKNEASIYIILYNSIKRALAPFAIKTSSPSPNLVIYANYSPLFNLNEGGSTKKLYEQIQQSKSTNNIDLCFQLYKKYIISTLHSELIIVDQHRAHKRIFYEYFLHNKNSTSQQLQFPISLFFSRIKLNLIKTIKKYLVAMGFSISFYEGRLIVNATPVEMNLHQVNDFFNTFLVKITEDRVDISSYQEILAYSIASSIAIKHGLLLTVKEMNHIIYELFYFCIEPNYTPSGEKVFITLNSNLINTQFHDF
ncbi:DNA mismatch repair protein MutL [Candidatus Uzinura diaspidicola str. ASNER]|uniref:DNA mismatch repair protein MutL n=1 Tax=Candidatus Uzinura diaspidicola str. ASNER TaxID=1133592 RepID=L7VGB6_9FLAO|nr:DNA mismatch repair protein MutL [Candidatus Uzinura diaspidicola str. ASNER]